VLIHLVLSVYFKPSRFNHICIGVNHLSENLIDILLLNSPIA
jgi:hypothetical protein